MSKKRKFVPYTGCDVDLLGTKRARQKRWISKATDWELIDAIEHKWLHKLPRHKLERLANYCSFGTTLSDIQKLEAEAENAQENVLKQAETLAAWNKVVHFLKSANRTFTARFDWHADCPVRIESVVVRHNWTPIDFDDNHVHKAQQVSVPSYDAFEEGDRCNCRNDAPDSVHHSVEGYPMGSAPVLFKVRVLKTVAGSPPDRWLVCGNNYQKCLIKGTGITMHIRRDYGVDYNDPTHRIAIHLPAVLREVETEMWMNERLGFCPSAWKLVMEYAQDAPEVVMCGTCGYPQGHEPQGCTASSYD